MWNTIQSVISSFLDVFASVCNFLISNPIFLVMFGISILSIIIGYVYDFVSHIKSTKKMISRSDYEGDISAPTTYPMLDNSGSVYYSPFDPQQEADIEVMESGSDPFEDYNPYDV